MNIQKPHLSELLGIHLEAKVHKIGHRPARAILTFLDLDTDAEYQVEEMPIPVAEEIAARVNAMELPDEPPSKYQPEPEDMLFFDDSEEGERS